MTSDNAEHVVEDVTAEEDINDPVMAEYATAAAPYPDITDIDEWMATHEAAQEEADKGAYWMRLETEK